MKKILFTCALFLALSLNAFSQNWLTDFEEAKLQALKTNKKILLVFQGSDWCAPCIKLDKEVFSTKEFQQLSKDNFVMMQADFPRKKVNKLPKDIALQNGELAEKYNNKGFFPLVVLLNSKGEVLGKMGYEKLSPIAYFNKLRAFEN